jgi:exopolysaccharide biosynthesis polyprenyl glycosylphosphotransferase
MAGFAVILFSLLFLQKFIFRTALASLRRLPGFEHRVLVYGKPELMKKLDGALRRSPKLGMRAVALINSRSEGEVEGESVLPLSASMIRAYNADSLVIAHSHLAEHTLQQLREVAVEAGAAIFFMAAVPGTGQNELDQIELDGQLLYGAHEPRFARLHAATSRALDVAVSVFTLALFSIPMAIVALTVRFTSEGPILFRQVRIGKDGKPFTMMKFRSMYTNMCGDAVSPTKGNDPRITPIGRLLRKSSLDELPQLFNVLRGEMALVGPRPEMPFIVEKYRQIHRQRLSVKPGLTGIWQISEHRKAPIHDNIEYDLYYVKHRSFAVDIAVILHTVVFAVKGV